MNDNRGGFKFLWRQIRLLVSSLLIMAAMKAMPKSANTVDVAKAFLALSTAIRKAV